MRRGGGGSGAKRWPGAGRRAWRPGSRAGGRAAAAHLAARSSQLSSCTSSCRLRSSPASASGSGSAGGAAAGAGAAVGAAFGPRRSGGELADGCASALCCRLTSTSATAINGVGLERCRSGAVATSPIRSGATGCSRAALPGPMLLVSGLPRGSASTAARSGATEAGREVARRGDGLASARPSSTAGAAPSLARARARIALACSCACRTAAGGFACNRPQQRTWMARRSGAKVRPQVGQRDSSVPSARNTIGGTAGGAPAAASSERALRRLVRSSRSCRRSRSSTPAISASTASVVPVERRSRSGGVAAIGEGSLRPANFWHA
jgi:hypothetical protein